MGPRPDMRPVWHNMADVYGRLIKEEISFMLERYCEFISSIFRLSAFPRTFTHVHSGGKERSFIGLRRDASRSMSTRMRHLGSLEPWRIDQAGTTCTAQFMSLCHLILLLFSQISLLPPPPSHNLMIHRQQLSPGGQCGHPKA